MFLESKTICVILEDQLEDIIKEHVAKTFGLQITDIYLSSIIDMDDRVRYRAFKRERK